MRVAAISTETQSFYVKITFRLHLSLVTQRVYWHASSTQNRLRFSFGRTYAIYKQPSVYLQVYNIDLIPLIIILIQYKENLELRTKNLGEGGGGENGKFGLIASLHV